MNHGEIWRRPGGSLVLIVSGDSYNTTGQHLYGCPIVRQRAPETTAGYAVTTAETDPVTGTVLLPELDRYDRDELTDTAGILTGATMSRIAEGLRNLFDL